MKVKAWKGGWVRKGEWPESVSYCTHYFIRPTLGEPRRAFSRGSTF